MVSRADFICYENALRREQINTDIEERKYIKAEEEKKNIVKIRNQHYSYIITDYTYFILSFSILNPHTHKHRIIIPFISHIHI